MNEVSIFEALEIAWRRKLLIVAVVVIATVSAYFFSEMQPDVYLAETTIVFPSSAPSMQIPGLGSLAQALGRMPTLPGALDGGTVSTSVIQPLLRSRALAGRVVRACGLRGVYGTGSI